MTLLHSANKQSSAIGYRPVLPYLKRFALRFPNLFSDRRPNITFITFDFRDVFVSTLPKPSLNLQSLRFRSGFLNCFLRIEVGVSHRSCSTAANRGAVVNTGKNQDGE